MQAHQGRHEFFGFLPQANSKLQAFLQGGWLFLLGLAVHIFPLNVIADDDVDCAEVKIVIEQKLSLERQAFDAHMVIRNGLDDALSDVKVELTFLDQNQQPVVVTTDPDASGAVFFHRIDRMAGLASLNGSSSLAGKTDADIHWLIIPSQGAGGDGAEGRMYYIGAKVTYTLAGETTTVDVTPDYVVVRPQPLLVLDYFLPGDVYADDPMTAEVEPVEPFTLGVRINNIGAGVSAKTTIESSQPKIVENHQGLLIDFRILGGYVGNDMLGKSMLLNFGDIAGQSAKVGRWLMETTLAGRFVEFNASFTHADSLGGAVTSLVKEVRTHRLVHDVLVDLPGHDDVYDFLAESGAGYRVYDSAGQDAEVADASGQAKLATAAGGNLQLVFPASAVLTHVKITDPFAGKKPIARVVRSDGKVLPVNNFWLSKTRNQDLSWSYFLHVFDSHSTGDYLLEFGQGTASSIAGIAYRDANNNGIYDAGELAEGNLGVTLKGLDEHGQNVLQQAYTDPSGEFKFVGLKPGRYQLEAAVTDGLVDGIWVAGSAGGNAQPGLIKDIALSAGAAGTGYLLAKRRPDAGLVTDDFADISIAVQAERSNLRGGESTDVTVTVSNLGEVTARSVLAQIAVPEGLTLQSATAGLGGYAGGAWSVGSLNKGQSASLVLTVKADTITGNKSRTISWPVSVSSSPADPHMANNSALLGMTVQSDKNIDLTQAITAESRVLMLLSCPQEVIAEQETCENAVKQAAETILADRVDQLQLVTTLTDWQVAQRSGLYNVLWLHGGAEKLDEQAIAEIRAAVRRGATVIADGLPGAQGSPFKLNQLAPLWGGRVVEPVTMDGGMVTLTHDSTAHSVTGALYGLQLEGAHEMATTASTPVMVSATWGHGQSWLMGFDLLAAIQGSSATFWSAFAEQQLTAFTPETRTEPALAGSSLLFTTTAHNLAAPGEAPEDIQMRMQWSEGVKHSQVSPVALRDEDRLLEWAWTLAPAAETVGTVRLTLPQTSTSAQVQTTLLDGEGGTLDMITRSIVVLGLDTVVGQVDSALSALDSADAATGDVIQQIRHSVVEAKTAQVQGDWDKVLSELAIVQDGLDALALVPHSLSVDELRLDVARWIGLAQQHWVKGGTGGASQPVQLELVSGDGQSTSVATPFADPLQVRVTDQQGQPVSGVAVRFVAPASGAGGLFTGEAGHHIEVLTDNQGLASVTMTANTEVGVYSVTAEVNGLVPVRFSLGNSSAQGSESPVKVLLVSGGGQIAKLNTAFDAPVVVQVLSATDQPVLGVSVQFKMPDTGASASFTGGQDSARVITDSNGTARSPVFVANAHQGSFQLDIIVNGVARPLQVTLRNELATVDPGKQFVGTTATGTGAVQASVSGGGDTCRFNPDETRMIVPGSLWTPLQKFLLPHGLFDFELVGCEPGGEVTITTVWPDLRGVTGYMKYGKTPFSQGKEVWYPPKGLRINLARKSVTYTIRDGGLGDDDLTVNGVIRDPGGPSVARAGDIKAVPMLDRWALMLLVLLLGLVALRYTKVSA